MPRFVKEGHPTVESSAPRDRANLLAQGYREEKATPQPAPTRKPVSKPVEKSANKEA